ncbi:MAG TPA: DegT/DnrJ/EryC1/StrS family aminotransferase [Actinomycetota bacterium]|nr:DegT/DnrJ/EryC1/StrS family aminotransferase [Actinomycetota bacterium]
MALTPSRNSVQPISALDLRAQRARLAGRIEAAIARVLDHGQFVLGPEVEALEKRLTEFCSARHAVLCANGTDALVVALRAWGVGAGHAVFVPAFTFAATAEAAALVGATPVLVDVSPADYTMDPASLARAIPVAREAGLRPKAVIAVDLFGQPADYSALHELAQAHGMKLLADAAQSFGAALAGRPVGTLAEATTTSFFPSKPLGCYGDGGAIFTDNEDLAIRLTSLCRHGIELGRHMTVGMNSRLDTIQAAVLIEKLSILPEEISARERTARLYTDHLAEISVTPTLRADVRSAWAQYTIQVDDRDRLREKLRSEGISSAVYYPEPLHAQPAFAGCPVSHGGLPVSEMLAARVLALPVHPYLSDRDIERVISVIRRTAIAATYAVPTAAAQGEL